MQQTAASAWRIWPSVREISWHPMPRPPELELPRSSPQPDFTFMHLRHNHHHPRWSPLLNFLAFCARLCTSRGEKTIEQPVLGDDRTANAYSSILLLDNSYEMAGYHHIFFSLSIFLHLL
jgi:hypothetical protein